MKNYLTPYRSLPSLFDVDSFFRFDSLFDSALQDFGSRFSVSSLEDKDGKETYVLRLPLAGFKQGDIDVSVENGTLTVKAKNEKMGQSVHSVTVGPIDIDAMEAKLEDGLLEIKLPASRPSRKTIKIK